MFFTRIAATLFLGGGLLCGIAAAQSTPTASPLARQKTCDLGGAVAGDRDERVVVTAWHDNSERTSMEMMCEVFANGDGVFQFRGLPWFAGQQWGRNRVIVVARSKSRVGLVQVRGDTADTDNLYIAMADKVDLRGRLLDRDSRKPIANGWIWPSIFNTRKEVWVTEPLLPWLTQTDKEGRFVLRSLPKGISIKALAGGYDHARTWVEIEDTSKPIDIKLPLGGRITGRVLMPDGKPAQRVQVETTSNNGGRGHTRTDDNGKFELSALGAGTFKVWAESRDLTVVAATNLHVRPGEVITEQTVQLVRGGFIVGRIVDATTGKPIVPGPQTDIAMYGPARGDGGSCQCTPVRDDGTFRIRAPAGQNRIYLRAAMGYNEPSEFVTVTEGQDTEVVWELVLHGKRR